MVLSKEKLRELEIYYYVRQLWTRNIYISMERVSMEFSQGKLQFGRDFKTKIFLLNINRGEFLSKPTSGKTNPRLKLKENVLAWSIWTWLENYCEPFYF